MIYTQKIKDAINFSIETHEVNQKQKRKGKNIPYITHPLTVGLILARAGAGEDLIVAGILHDTIEDSIAEKKVNQVIISERFGENVAKLVSSVTEQNKGLSWEERKKESLDHIRHFSEDSLFLKSADTISNVSEILDDYEKEGAETFSRFNAPKERILENYLQVIIVISKAWSGNPLLEDLQGITKKLKAI